MLKLHLRKQKIWIIFLNWTFVEFENTFKIETIQRIFRIKHFLKTFSFEQFHMNAPYQWYFSFEMQLNCVTLERNYNISCTSYVYLTLKIFMVMLQKKKMFLTFSKIFKIFKNVTQNPVFSFNTLINKETLFLPNTFSRFHSLNSLKIFGF